MDLKEFHKHGQSIWLDYARPLTAAAIACSRTPKCTLRPA